MKNVSRMIAGAVIVLLLAFSCIPMNQEVNAAGKPAKITAMCDTTFLTKEAGQQQFLKEYKKLTGIELAVNQPSHNQYNEKLLIAFASGDIPDVVEIQPDHLEVYVQLAREGAIVPLDKYIAKSSVFKKIKKDYVNCLKYRGHIYATPLDSGGGCPTYIRKDWLDNLGLKVPTTWAELYKVAKAFTFNDPDKNGKNDTMGFTLPGLDEAMYMQDYYQGADHDFVMKHGKWVDGFTQPEFKRALTRLRQAYKDKIIDQELFTNKTSTCREKYFAGKVGIFSYWAGDWGRKLEHDTKTNCPKAEVIAIPAIRETHYINRIPPMIAITKSCKNPEAVFKHYNEYMHNGGQGQMLFSHGVEGVHWSKKGGKYQQLPSLINPTVLFNKAYVEPALSIGPMKDSFVLEPKIVQSVKALHSRMVQMKLPPVSDSYNKYAADLNTLKKEIMAKVIMGTYSVDQGIKIYKEKSARLNVSKILKEANK